MIEEVGFAADSLLEGDGFEPSVPRRRDNGFEFKPSALGREEGEAFGKMGTVTEAKSGLETAAHLTGDRGFESISLQQRVRCEPDFLDHVGVRPVRQRAVHFRFHWNHLNYRSFLSV
jgi:hypothetical protein